MADEVRKMPVAPSLLYQAFGRGEMTREEVHAAMAVHAEALIEEMEEDYANPVAAYFERLRNRRATARLLKRHSEVVVRAAFAALGELADFPPGRWLWNAWHWDMPLHCFVRMKREPVFRVARFEYKQMEARVVVDYGVDGGKLRREAFRLQRDVRGRMEVLERKVM